MPAELVAVLDDLDAVTASMKVEWTELGQQLRDAVGNRSDRRAAAARARKQWSPQAAQA